VSVYRDRRAKGLCGWPGCKNASEKSYCPRHMSRIADSQTTKKRVLERLGLCKLCGQYEVVGNMICDDCNLERQAVWRAQHYLRAELGNCAACGRKREPERVQYTKCARCAAQLRIKRLEREEKYRKTLKRHRR
jgi:hypothetical protein